MRGIHDLGGMRGFGPVEAEADEPVFHEPWEGRMYALAGAGVGAAGGNSPKFRHAIERMDPGHYLTSSYYEHWFTGVATLLVEAGVLGVDELAARAGGTVPLSRRTSVGPDDVDRTAPREAPRFAAGEAVRVKVLAFDGHTRCPGYLFGRSGTVDSVGALEPIPEWEAHLGERVLEPTYSVRFDSHELWGVGAESRASVYVDLYDRYLEPA